MEGIAYAKIVEQIIRNVNITQLIPHIQLEHVGWGIFAILFAIFLLVYTAIVIIAVKNCCMIFYLVATLVYATLFGYGIRQLYQWPQQH
jgi:hypothetical protein